MDLSNNTIERLCRIFGHLGAIEKTGVEFVSSAELAGALGATSYTVRKDLSLLGITGFTRKGYEVSSLKKELGSKLRLAGRRKACIVGLGRLGSALLDYEKFQEDGFEIVAGFDRSVNKLERIRTHIEVYPVGSMKDVIKEKGIEMGIITVPGEHAQEVADRLTGCGVRGILNFSPVEVSVPDKVVSVNMDFTNALRFIAAKLGG
ncbi:MAG: redox-sensing transcriptional repressor Rex [Candidatus Omnitrophica bacterium]|nr:redox-sensing transcriptional repressor Rex [Candidatus Omnitrophota bacterium]